MERIILEVDLLYKDAPFPFVFIQIRFLSRERSLGGAVRKNSEESHGGNRGERHEHKRKGAPLHLYLERPRFSCRCILIE